MVDAIFTIFDKLPPVRKRDPNVAVIVGLLFGGVGLAVYLKSIVDLVIPIVIAGAFVAALGDPGWFVGAALSAAYGYFRVLSSNTRLQSPTRAANGTGTT